MPTYQENISNLNNPSFDAIRRLAWNEISHFDKDYRDNLYNGLKRGTALIDSHEHLCQYLHSFGKMHKAKLLDAFSNLPNEIFQRPFEIIDWGCGQAMGVVNLFDFIKNIGAIENVSQITLIEPSQLALERGKLHVDAYLDKTIPVTTINEFFENITSTQIRSKTRHPVIHIFSNILDVSEIDLKHLTSLIDSSVNSNNYLVAVGPLNPNNKRIDSFFRYFDINLSEELYATEAYQFANNNWTYKAKIYKLEVNEKGHLIPIEYYPTVQFQAAYELDCVRANRKKTCKSYSSKLSHFEVAAPFDLGASVYEDVHPILAVLNNIITRGLPTRTSVFIEEIFQKTFANTKKMVNNGEISFTGYTDYNFEHLLESFESNLDQESWRHNADLEELQLLLSPIAIARFQKVLVEALITNHLSLESNEWNIMVEENDVPFSAIAIQDFKNLFESLTGLSHSYENFKLPKINLVILGNNVFKDSGLHLNQNVHTSLNSNISSIKYDLVISQSVLKSASSSIESFSKFKCKNACYFNIRTIEDINSTRNIYTSSLIQYKDVVKKDERGNYYVLEEQKELLTYLLQLLFRKESFRPGQLPILDRALKNLPVIGLLPTGGGKSLTYQIAALMQPGITIVIDPLKSLMKDQYDGLINAGIDCASYINSSLSSQEKKSVENQLESSQLLFIFLSPERLAIASFRERLKHMHDYNVYFSYGVIDEVHCVSEWGHDFRFSYLHLGRNLYNYVRAKENEISLFGLTATASFDVLADVERELSGNGAFTLDSDVIIRYENTNRLELQYKIEKVPIKFEEDQYFDRNNTLPSHLPRAINISSAWSSYDSKSEFLQEYVTRVPEFINELQKDENVRYIKDSFVERQNNDEGSEFELSVDMPMDYYSVKDSYDQAGIIFCPHVNKSGISVNKNAEKLKSNLIPETASFTGQDNDVAAIKNLELFRDNKSPLMVATKAFGMGIDKPNVRFTVNLNYSSSLESFVQEAGRSGRDRKMALATIFISDYEIASFKFNGASQYPLGMLRNRWFYKNDLIRILNEYNISYNEDDILVATPQSDVVKLFCPKDNKMFAFRECNTNCSAYQNCTLKNSSQEARGWKTESELIAQLNSEDISVSKKNFRYLNGDYETVMYFYNESFKGDYVEKTYMHRLLNIEEILVVNNNTKQKNTGFLSSLLDASTKEKIIVFIPYSQAEYTDLSKAIYRMCCIELIEDFTQDYQNNQFRIVVTRKNSGGYFDGLKNYLLRYYTLDRAEQEIKKAKSHQLKNDDLDPITTEIYKCLWYLTSFIYDKISEKRKRAIDDIRSFCIEGLNEDINWIESNEKLKDFIYYYFNSKYAKTDYTADNGEDFSLIEDTEGGKVSNQRILNKYLRVIDDDIVGFGTPLDNVKHLNGAVRLISRSLTDSNPALSLLEAFCLIYLGIKKNKAIENQFITSYNNGMAGFMERSNSVKEFWKLFKKYNKAIRPYLSKDQYETLTQETMIVLHAKQLQSITLNYIN